MRNKFFSNDHGFSVSILAGGMGTRLKSRSSGIPKPMVPICGIPVLEHLIVMIRKHGFYQIMLLVHHQNEVIRDYFGDGERWGVKIRYSVEVDPRGTAGALYDALEYLADDFLVLYGDTFASIDLDSFFSAHIESNADATLFLHPNDHPNDSDLVEVNNSSRVLAIHPYPHPAGIYYPNLVNAGLYAIKKEAFYKCQTPKLKSDLAKNTFPEMLSRNFHLKGYISPEYIKDMGTPERLDKVEVDVLSGRVKNLDANKPRSAVFIDRDGTINKEVNYLRELSQMELLPGVGEAIRKLNSVGVLAVCITNQPVIARGELSFEGLSHIHAKLDHLLGLDSAYIDRYYTCPHHPDFGYKGERTELKIVCTCRKPAIGLIENAVRELSISVKESWIIGDSTADIAAGKAAGLSTILVRTGYGGQDNKFIVQPDYIFYNLNEAIDWILTGRHQLENQFKKIIPIAMSSRLVLIGGAARSGKSVTAQVLAEEMQKNGRRSHIISLDGWLLPQPNRSEGLGVSKRYDMSGFMADIDKVLNSRNSIEFILRSYDRKSRSTFEFGKVNVELDDCLIVEGVPALLDERLFKKSDLKIFVEANDVARENRLFKDYEWRGLQDSEILKIISSREGDEVSCVKYASSIADFIIHT
jgi:histidinol-phosphate phosphatase family protein